MKAQSEFNWIFVIMAGAVILTFFVSFGLKYKSLQDEKLSIELLINLDNSLTNLQASPFNVFDVINVPKDVEITCNKFIIGQRNYDNEKIIFSPKNLKGKTYIWYKPFNFPFKVDNFYYIINSLDKFYLVYDAESKDFADLLIEGMPEKFKENAILVRNKQPNGKNIFLYDSATKDIKIIKKNDKISITYNDKFYDDVNIGLAYGAIFGNDFECNYAKSISSVEKISKIYQNKLVLLQDSNCNYAGFSKYLSNLNDLKNSDSISIENLNNALAGQNCPTLY